MLNLEGLNRLKVYFGNGVCCLLVKKDRAIAQTVSRWLPTAEARVQTRVF
jgi:hypothetical protein